MDNDLRKMNTFGNISPITDEENDLYLYSPFVTDKKIESKETKSFRAVIYARVSTQEQADPNKPSMFDQLDLGRKVIETKNWEPIQEYRDDGISGHKIEDRHGLQEMLRDARGHKFDIIVIKDHDRFARNKDAAAIIRQELKSLGIQVYAINTPIEPRPINEYDPDDDNAGTMIETMSDMRSDMERQSIIKRMKMGKTRRAEMGLIPNRIGYGYDVDRKIDETTKKIVRNININNTEAEIVKHISKEYLKGIGVRKIVIDMNNRGWRTRKGGLWTIRGVKYILTNPTYCGKVCWGWRHADYQITKEWRRRGKEGIIRNGKHPAIITEGEFKAAQQIRIGRNRGGKGGVERSKGLLTGMCKCIRCGYGTGYQKRYHSRSKKNPDWSDTTTYEYICSGYKYHGICSSRVMSALKLEGEVLDHIKNIYAHPQVQKKIVYNQDNQEISDHEKEIGKLNIEIESFGVKKDRYRQAYEEGVDGLKEYKENIERLEEKIKINRVERDRLVSLCSLSSQKSASMAKLVSSLKDFDVAWNKMEFDEKRLILRSIIREIRAGDGKVEIDFIL